MSKPYDSVREEMLSELTSTRASLLRLIQAAPASWALGERVWPLIERNDKLYQRIADARRGEPLLGIDREIDEILGAIEEIRKQLEGHERGESAERVTLRVPRTLPAFLETETGDFVSSEEATTAQWRTAAAMLQKAQLTERERKTALRPVRQMIKIADAIGASDDAALVPLVKASAAGEG